MIVRSLRRRGLAVGLAMTLSVGTLAGCANANAGKPDKPDNKLTVWSLENLPPRMAATREVVHRFEQRTGIEIELVGVDEAQLPQMVMSAAAAGELPDVIGAVPMGQVWQMHGNDLLNTQAASEVVDALDERTFDRNALRLTSQGDRNLAVPSDAWLQLLLYREDLLADAGLPTPDTYRGVTRAAQRLHGDGREGIALATDPGDVFTQQSFESLALANDCQLVGPDDEVALDSPACRTAFATYDRLARRYGAPGAQTVDSTRATYFSGRSAMLIWSSMVLDELAGLRDDALPNCPACRQDAAFLADHTGVVTAMRGPHGDDPAQFGEITSWVITRTAETRASRTFVRYMLDAGYQDWFGMAPEGKIPVRKGTVDQPRKFERAWRASEVGVDTRKPLNEVFPDALLDQLQQGVSDMRRWGIADGHGALVGATNGELPVPKAVGAMTSGQISAEEAAREADAEVTALEQSLR